MGLAIAVVIVSVGILFLVSLSLNQPPDDSASVFQQDQFTQNVLDAYLKTSNPDCPARSVARYFVWNVTQAGDRDCRDPETWNRTGGLNETLHTAVQNYIGREYRFEVRSEVCAEIYGPGCDVVMESGTCRPQEESTGRAGRQTLTKHPQEGSVEIILWLCNAQ